jgi:hypothetical protein
MSTPKYKRIKEVSLEYIPVTVSNEEQQQNINKAFDLLFENILRGESKVLSPLSPIQSIDPHLVLISDPL